MNAPSPTTSVAPRVLSCCECGRPLRRGDGINELLRPTCIRTYTGVVNGRKGRSGRPLGAKNVARTK